MYDIGTGSSASTTVELDGQVDIVSLESEVSASPLGGTNGDPKEWFGRIAARTYVTGADRVRITLLLFICLVKQAALFWARNAFLERLADRGYLRPLGVVEPRPTCRVASQPSGFALITFRVSQFTSD